MTMTERNDDGNSKLFSRFGFFLSIWRLKGTASRMNNVPYFLQLAQRDLRAVMPGGSHCPIDRAINRITVEYFKK